MERCPLFRGCTIYTVVVYTGFLLSSVQAETLCIFSGQKPGQTLMINNGGVAEVYQVQYTCCLGWEYIEILIPLFFSQWNADLHQWDKVQPLQPLVQFVHHTFRAQIGDAISKAPESTVYQGQVRRYTLAIESMLRAIAISQEYDYVFDIELDEGGPTMRKLKLPYNKDSQLSTYTAISPHVLLLHCSFSSVLCMFYGA